MENENENIDSQNDEGIQEAEQTPENVVIEPTLDDYNALKEKNKQLFQRAKKAETDLKSVKGVKSVDTSQFVSKEEYEQDMFYAKHPEYSDLKPIISKMGNKPEEVINDDTFKAVYEKYKMGKEAVEVKSVLHSNPRIGKATDKLGEAREAAAAGNIAQAGDLAVKGVIEAFDL